MYDNHMVEFISLEEKMEADIEAAFEEAVIEEFESDDYDWGIDSESLSEWQNASAGIDRPHYSDWVVSLV